MIFAPLIDRWAPKGAMPEEAHIAAIRELATDLGLQPKNVRSWRSQDSIPAGWFIDVVKAAQARGFDDVTVEALAEMAALRRSPVGEAA